MARPALRVWLLGVPLALALLLFILLVLVDIFDRMLIADPLAARVEESTGRALSVEGFDLRWGWPLSLHGENLRLANATWGREDPLLQVAAFDLSVNPFKLLGDPPYAQLHLRQPQLLVERSAEGQWNWQMDPSSTQQSAQDAETAGPVLPVTVLAEGGQVVYFSQDSAAPMNIELERFAATSGNGAEGAEESRDLTVTLRASHDGLPLELDSTLAIAAEHWQGSAKLQAGDSTLDAEFAVDATAQPVAIDATLTSELLVPLQLTEFLPASDNLDESVTDPSTIVLPRLDGINADVDIQLAQLRLPDFDLSELTLMLGISEGKLQLDPLQARLGDVTLHAQAAMDTTAAAPELQVDLEVPRQSLAGLPASLRGNLPLDAAQGQIAVQLQLRLETSERELPLSLDTALAQLGIPHSRFLYAWEAQGEQEGEQQSQPAEIALNLQVQPAGGRPAVSLETQGLQAPSYRAELTAPPLGELTDTASAYPLELVVSTDDARATVEAELENLLEGEGFTLHIDAEGEALPSMPALAFTPPPPAPFAFEAALGYSPGVWTLEDVALAYGPSQLSGSASYTTDNENGRPHISVNVHTQMVDLTAFPFTGDRQDSSAQGAQDETTAASTEGENGQVWIPDTVAEALKALDAHLDLNADRIRISEAVEMAQLQLAARLEQGQLQVENFDARLADGRLSGSLTADAAESPVDGQLLLTMEDLRLGSLADTFTPVEDHLGRLSGELQLAFTEREVSDTGPAEDFLLPSLGRLSFNGTRLHFRDIEVDTDLSFTVADEGPSAQGEQSVMVSGSGRYRGEEATLELRGGPLAALRDARQPYPLTVTLELAQTRLALDGQLARAWLPSSAQFRFSARGNNPAHLETLFGDLFIASFPPYQLEGDFAYEGSTFTVSDFDGTLGDSDIAGEVRLETSTGSPSITASFSSDNMDLDDFAGIIGGSPAAGPDDTASPAQQQAAEELQQRERVLPRATFDVDGLQRVEAEIDYRAQRVDAANLPLDDFSLSVTLQDGHLVAEPVNFGIGEGSMELRLDMQARDSVLEGVAELDMRGVDLAEALQHLDIAAGSVGTVGGQGKFWMSGDSTAALLGSADGGAMLMMTGGALDALLVEAAGLDLGESLLVAAGLGDAVPIECAYASVHSDQGIVEIERFVLDSEDSLFFLDGSIDLQQETLDLTLYPEAKDPSFPAADSPLGISGSFREPELDLLSGALAARSLGAVALATVAGPAGALLPFMGAGEDDESVACQGWVDGLREAYADAR